MQSSLLSDLSRHNVLPVVQHHVSRQHFLQLFHRQQRQGAAQQAEAQVAAEERKKQKKNTGHRHYRQQPTDQVDNRAQRLTRWRQDAPWTSRPQWHSSRRVWSCPPSGRASAGPRPPVAPPAPSSWNAPPFSTLGSTCSHQEPVRTASLTSQGQKRRLFISDG